MEKYSVCTYKGDDGFDSAYFDTFEEAKAEAEKRSENERFTASEIKKYKPYVLISLEECDEDGKPIEYIDSIEAVFITKAF